MPDTISQRHEVTQEDVDAATQIHRKLGEFSRKAAIEGIRDESTLVQAFARHRAASEVRLLARMVEEDMVEAVAMAICRSVSCRGFCHSQRCADAIDQWEKASYNALTAIAAKLKEQRT